MKYDDTHDREPRRRHDDDSLGDAVERLRVSPGKMTLTMQLGPAVQRKESGAGRIDAGALALVEAAFADSGHELPAEVRARLESVAGRDLSNVRVHTGARASAAAEALSASAYTVGRDIFFGEGAYSPGSEDGLGLIAHEVAHTVQQGGGEHRPHRGMEISSPGQAAEQQADQFAAAARGAGREGASRLAPIGQPSVAPALQRQDREVSEQARLQLIQNLTLPYLIAMYEDTFRGQDEPRVPPARLPGVGDWHRSCPRDWLRGQRSTIEGRIRDRLTSLAQRQEVDQIRSVGGRIGRIQREDVRATLQGIFQEATGEAMTQHEGDLDGAIDSLRAALRRYAQGPLRQQIFRDTNAVLSDQTFHYENFAGAMNVFRDVVLNGSTRFSGEVSRATTDAARAAVDDLSEEELAAMRRDEPRVRDALTAEGRAQLRDVARDRDYGIPERFPEQAIR